MAYKAFVSSTFEDLKEHRKVAISYLRRAGIFVDPMEDWTASTDEPKIFSQDRIKGCDLCILLVGFRRGHISQDEELSITQMEYRAALKLGIDVLVFMLAEESPWPRKFDELDKDPKIREFRSELMEHRGVGFFTLEPKTLDIGPAVTRWMSEKQNSSSTEFNEQNLLEGAITTYTERLLSESESAKNIENTESPYKALVEYDLKDASLFFGRDDEIQELVKAVNGSRLTVLHAKSGAGKTSLLKAGVRLKLLAKGDIPVYVRPQQSPVDLAIKRAILPHLEKYPILMDTSLHDFLYEVVKFLKGKRLILILDQFEEVFVFQSPESRAQFSRQLAFCLDNDLLPVHWIISLRGEFLSELATFDPPVDNPIEKNLLLQSLSRKNASLAVLEPARKKGIAYEEELIDVILDELGPQQIHPPELQIICSALYEALKGNKLITHEAYNELGRAKGILQGHFNTVMTRKIPKDGGRAVLARQVLISLISSDKSRLSRSEEDLKAELISQNVDVIYLSDVLARLVDSHLLRIEETIVSQRSVITYELAHDYLVDKIELDPIMQNRKIAQELIDYKTRYYVRNKKLILSPEELNFVSPLLDQLDLSDQKVELVNTSRKVAQKSSNISAVSKIVSYGIGIIAVFLAVSKLLQAFSSVSSYITLFWGAVVIFSIIGWNRGWTKELLVTFSATLGLLLNFILRKYFILNFMPENDVTLFWIRTNILLVLVWFGYQISIPNLIQRGKEEQKQDALFGGMIGAFNGYLVMGSLLYFYAVADFPYSNILSRPENTELISSMNALLIYMPPQILGEPGIYFAFLLCAIFVLIVFVQSEKISSLFKTVRNLFRRTLDDKGAQN